MPSKNFTRLTGLLLVGLIGVSACGSATTTTVYYDQSANSNLTGKTYALTGGGTLQPA